MSCFSDDMHFNFVSIVAKLALHFVSKGLVNQRYFFYRQQNNVLYRIAHGLYRSKLEG